MPSLDVVTTALRRPEIFRLTLESFNKGLLQFFPRKRLILNIDPIGGAPGDEHAMLEIARKYFQDVVHQTPQQASFPAAVYWAWSQARSDWILHLEDDWLLNRRINLDHLFLLMQQPVDFIKLNLQRNDANLTTGFSLNPSLIRYGLVRRLLPAFDLTKNPEKQFSKLVNSEAAAGKLRLTCYGTPGMSPMVTDIGKRWTFLYFDRVHGSAGLYEYKERSAALIRRNWLLLRHHFFLAFYRARIWMMSLKPALP